MKIHLDRYTIPIAILTAAIRIHDAVTSLRREWREWSRLYPIGMGSTTRPEDRQ